MAITCAPMRWRRWLVCLVLPAYMVRKPRRRRQSSPRCGMAHPDIDGVRNDRHLTWLRGPQHVSAAMVVLILPLWWRGRRPRPLGIVAGSLLSGRSHCAGYMTAPTGKAACYVVYAAAVLAFAINTSCWPLRRLYDQEQIARINELAKRNAKRA